MRVWPTVLTRLVRVVLVRGAVVVAAVNVDAAAAVRTQVRLPLRPGDVSASHPRHLLQIVHV